MKVVKILAVVLAVVLLAGFVCIMFLPIDTFVAKRSAGFKGYDVPTSYTDSIYRYYYNKLGEKEQEAYRLVYAALSDDSAKDFPKQVVIPSLSDKELEAMYTSLSYDNPELFFLGNKCSMTKIGSINYFVPQYLMNRKEYEKKWSQVTSAAQKLLGSIPGTATTEYAKELFLHDYLVQNCEYDESYDNDVYTMYGVLVNGRANCEGYSRTMQYLLRALGIYNYLAVGNAEGEKDSFAGHMWNIVKIDGNMYNLDVTWDDYAVMDLVDFPDNSVSHVYFNMSTADISRNRTTDDQTLWADCVMPSYGYFKNKGLYFSSYNAVTEQSMKDAIVESLSTGYNSVEFAFSDRSSYDSAFDILVTRGSMYNIILSANRQVAAGLRVDPSSVQYAMDENNLVLRFFFLR
ncbi:MAG: hypothetical protein K5836_03020 [Clostridiales bacterium]|nr:hypothetical protein [Clostridiales bacterium]